MSIDNDPGDIGAEASAQESTRPCIYCSEPIAAEAQICRHCLHYQSPWKNQLRALAAGSGIAGLLAATMTYSFETAGTLRDRWQEKVEVQLLDFESGKGAEYRAVLSNSGNRAILVKDFTIVFGPDRKGGNITYPVMSEIDPGQTVVIDRKQDETEDWSYEFRQPGVDALAEPAIRSAPYLRRQPPAGACFARIFFDKANSNLTRLWEYGGNNLLVPVVSEELLKIDFVTVQDNQPRQAELPVMSTYVRHRTPECSTTQSG